MTIFEFLNSNFLQTLIALFVWLFIFAIYFLQKKDDKKRRALILYLEVLNAERLIESLKTTSMIDWALNILNIDKNSWVETKVFFAKDLWVDELDNLDIFVNRCFYIQYLWDEHRKLSIEKTDDKIEEKRKLIWGQIWDHTKAIRYLTWTTIFEKIKKIAKVK